MIAENIKFFEEKSGKQEKRIVADIKSKIEKEISRSRSSSRSARNSKNSKKPKNKNSSLKSPRKLTSDRLNFLEKSEKYKSASTRLPSTNQSKSFRWIEEISKIRKKIENSNDISSTIQYGFKLFEQLSKEHENFLKKTTKKPDDELLQKYLSPQLKLISEIGSLAAKATGVDRHYISMIEAATAIFGWFQYSSVSEGKKMIKEHVDSSIYYTTKIAFEKRDKFHSDLIAVWKSLLLSFEPYNDYPSGLWNNNTSGNIQTKTETAGTDKKEKTAVTSSTAMKKIPNIPKEPKKKLDGKKWIIENYKKEEIHLEVKPDQVRTILVPHTRTVINYL